MKKREWGTDKTDQVTVRVDEELADRIREAAFMARLPVSTWIRRLIEVELNGKGKNQT